MSEVLDELNDLGSQLREIQDTIKKVLSFPEKVERPCLLPVSKTCYFPGKYVHTNEFVMDLPKQGEEVELRELDWKSHTETATELRARAAILQSRILMLEGPAGSDSDDLVLMRTVHLPANISLPAATGPSSRPMITQMKAAELKKGNTGGPVSVHVPMHVPAKQSVQLPVSATSQDNSNDKDFSSSSFFEIREYEDEHGQVASHELVDISQQIKSYQSQQQQQQSQLPSQLREGVASGSDSLDSRTLQALREIEEKLGSSANIGNFGGSEPASAPPSGLPRVAVNPEVAFAAELLAMSAAVPITVPPKRASASSLSSQAQGGNLGGDFSFLDALEDEEDEAEREAAALLKIRNKEKELEAKRMLSASEGWGRGFLSGAGSGGGGNAKSNSPRKTVAGATTVSEPAHIHVPAPVAVPAIRKAAFTNMIVEKNI